MRNILIVTKVQNGGGTERHTAGISAALNVRGFNVEIVNTNDGFWQLYQKIKHGGYDVVHAFLPRPYLYCHIACWLAGHHTIFMSRRSLTGCYQTPLIRFIEKLLHKRTKVLIGNSPAVVEQLRKEAPKADIRLIRNGIKITPKPRCKSTVSTMVTVANAFEYKGYDDLLAAMVGAASILPEPWRLMLIGKGTEKYNGWRIEPLGFLNEDSIREWLSKADLFILPSHEEGCSNALLEAMACGVPVIATDVGGNNDAVTHMKSGLLVPPKDIRALMQTIIWAANHPIECQAMAYQAKIDVNAKFSFNRCLKEYEALYSSAA